jgi:hypothetical protein
MPDLAEALDSARQLRAIVDNGGEYWPDYERVLAWAVLDALEQLRTELERTEGDLTVAVHEAQRAREESATNRETGCAWRGRALIAETQQQAALSLCDEGERLGKQLVWIGELRAALGAAE